jgi:hypothetical protein
MSNKINYLSKNKIEKFINDLKFKNIHIYKIPHCKTKKIKSICLY